jgi:hypothetical protein
MGGWMIADGCSLALSSWRPQHLHLSSCKRLHLHLYLWPCLGLHLHDNIILRWVLFQLYIIVIFIPGLCFGSLYTGAFLSPWPLRYF